MLENLLNKIREEYNIYKDDEYIINKLNNHILNELPNIIKNTKNNQKYKEDRKLLLTEGHNKFVNDFINKNTYFYCMQTELFFYYDKNNYNICREDDIIHNILSLLTQKSNNHQPEYYQQQLLPWKFKIKTSIIKNIKELSLYNSIPESITIQNILNLFNNHFFYSKNEAKYFLTILGDIILKKSSNNIYFIHLSSKILLRTLENIGTKYFGNHGIFNYFRFKFHEHNFSDCRLLKFKYNNNETYFHENIYENIKRNIINIFVVACYLSNRYNTSDQYLLDIQDSDNSIINHILFLKNNDINMIISRFIERKIQKNIDSSISFKNMNYIWKQYLDEINIPNIIFSQNLKLLLKEKLNYITDDDIFSGYTSPRLPFVSNFLNFWDECMEENVDEYFIEIDEICIFLKQWLNTSKRTNVEIKQENLLNLIKHFYPDINIEESKYIYGYSCKLFNKKSELKSFLDINININSNSNSNNLSMYELYNLYTKTNKSIITISKTYFDQYFHQYFQEYFQEYLKNNAL